MKNINTEKQLTLEHLRNFAGNLVAEGFEKHGCAPRTFICFGRHRNIAVGSHLPDDNAKAIFASEFRTLCIAEDALAVVCIAEIWISPPDSVEKNIRPSEHPDRREYVMISIERRGTPGELNLYPIIREGSARPRLGECQNYPFNDLTGQFAQFLPAKPPTEGQRIIAAASLKRNGHIVPANPFQHN